MLLGLQPSPVTRLNRAIALRYADSPQAALAELDRLADALDGYHLYHATCAELLRAVGQPEAARAADERALALAANQPRSTCSVSVYSGRDGIRDRCGAAPTRSRRRRDRARRRASAPCWLSHRPEGAVERRATRQLGPGVRPAERRHGQRFRRVAGSAAAPRSPRSTSSARRPLPSALPTVNP